MQLACKHVLDPVLATDGEEATKLTPTPLRMAASQTASVSANASGEATPNESSSNGVQSHDQHPEWLQDRGGLDKWILANLNDGQRRLQLVKALTNMALPFQYTASRVMQALGDLYSENVS